MSLKLPFRFSTLYLSISKSSFKPITAFPLLNSYAHVHHRHITTTTMASTTPVKNLALTSTLTLQNSPSHTEIPHIGFGVYKSPPEVCVSSVLHAIKTGYRQIDTAQFYANESEVGEAIAKSEIPRSELYVTTKVIAYSGSFEKSYQECVKSVRKIGGEGGYVDLFLIHTPSMGPEKRKELWKALEKLKDEGLAKDIGVSNLYVPPPCPPIISSPPARLLTQPAAQNTLTKSSPTENTNPSSTKSNSTRGANNPH